MNSQCRCVADTASFSQNLVLLLLSLCLNEWSEIDAKDTASPSIVACQRHTKKTRWSVDGGVDGCVLSRRPRRSHHTIRYRGSTFFETFANLPIIQPRLTYLASAILYSIVLLIFSNVGFRLTCDFPPHVFVATKLRRRIADRPTWHPRNDRFPTSSGIFSIPRATPSSTHELPIPKLVAISAIIAIFVSSQSSTSKRSLAISIPSISFPRYKHETNATSTR